MTTYTKNLTDPNLGSASLQLGLVAGTGGASATPTGGRVFWSGGGRAMDEAALRAAGTGGATLEMTLGGKALTFMQSLSRGGVPLVSPSVMGPLWNFASSRFAAGATNFATVVIDQALYRGSASTWVGTELPRLLQNGVTIFKVTVKG